MTDKQPEALLYADKLEKVFGLSEYADEIRRLHQSEREGWRYADEIEQERKRLHEVNAELVEALRDITVWYSARDSENEILSAINQNPEIYRAMQALAKAEGK